MTVIKYDCHNEFLHSFWGLPSQPGAITPSAANFFSLPTRQAVQLSPFCLPPTPGTQLLPCAPSSPLVSMSYCLPWFCSLWSPSTWSSFHLKDLARDTEEVDGGVKLTG